jgi:hypothetical protein
MERDKHTSLLRQSCTAVKKFVYSTDPTSEKEIELYNVEKRSDVINTVVVVNGIVRDVAGTVVDESVTEQGKR